MSKQPKTAVVTGASTGIGYACVEKLTGKGWQVFAAVRKDEDAKRLTDAFGDKVTPLMMDVTDQAAIDAAAVKVRKALNGRTLNGLVNNAGVAVAGPLLELPIEDFERQMAINVTGQVRVTQAFGPLLGADLDLKGEPGRIVMMSSMAGEMGAPFLAPYAASKHALEGISKSLRRELNVFGIQVVVIGPGAVATPIWAKSDEVDVSAYESSIFYDALVRLRNYMSKSGPEGFPPSKIADRVFRAFTDAKPRFRYAIVPQRFMNWSLPRMLPARKVDEIVTKRLGLHRVRK
ncbi:MAG: SDR family oxidoreductase [Maricaulis sp.]|jgi:NAD(P)-dependent dehydrogenase (short-subunit alcohol dehydrogenase family)|uniref:SDR family oxidoreductase n=1 Tax=Maricaulis sp. TaxID=1486257 RepID=UPI00261E6A91|nr:SDR family oxidoreductase [Maricaulis sp.]MDM7983693.1 SDR family oxidoreductase [Maricaulis sp.]